MFSAISFVGNIQGLVGTVQSCRDRLMDKRSNNDDIHIVILQHQRIRFRYAIHIGHKLSPQQITLRCRSVTPDWTHTVNHRMLLLLQLRASFQEPLFIGWTTSSAEITLYRLRRSLDGSLLVFPVSSPQTRLPVPWAALRRGDGNSYSSCPSHVSSQLFPIIS